MDNKYNRITYVGNRIFLPKHFTHFTPPIAKSFRIGNLFYLYRTKGVWWFRFFKGYGLHGKNIKLIGLSFSERNGYSKYLKLGSWIIKTLK